MLINCLRSKDTLEFLLQDGTMLSVEKGQPILLWANRRSQVLHWELIRLKEAWTAILGEILSSNICNELESVILMALNRMYENQCSYHFRYSTRCTSNQI